MSEQHLPVGTPVTHGPWRGVVCGLSVTDEGIEYHAHDSEGKGRTFGPGELERIEQPKPLAVRPIVAAFAEAMERKLAANDGVKGEWYPRGLIGLLYDLAIEHGEYADAVYAYIGEEQGNHIPSEYKLAELRKALLSEAADCALYAMMLADACGALPATTDRGRAYAEPVAVKGE